jgi:tetratricopeptide (TPR) repeat protein
MKRDSYNNLGNVYHSLGEDQKAIEFYQQSLAIFQEIGDIRGVKRIATIIWAIFTIT